MKRIGELSFEISEDFKCIGIPSLTESSDEIILVDGNRTAMLVYSNLNEICIEMTGIVLVF